MNERCPEGFCVLGGALLESLVSAGEAGNAPAVKKEYGPRAAFWMAVATATPPVSQPAKPADDAAETKDETGANDSLPAERAPTPETRSEEHTSELQSLR